MGKIRINYTWHELGEFAVNAFKSFLTGVLGLLWLTILLTANFAVRAYKTTVKAIRAYPCVAFVAVFLVMTVAIFATHANLKVKLTTAEWQRDSLRESLDSMKVIHDGKMSYSYQPYKEQ